MRRLDAANHRAAVFCAAALTVAMVCGSAVKPSSGTPGQEEEVSGEYILMRANGKDLPTVVSESPSYRQEVTGGSIVLEATGTFSWRTDYRYTQDGRVETSESSGRGTYSRQGATIIFSFENDDLRVPATLDGNTITMQVDVEMVYRKRPAVPLPNPRLLPGAAPIRGDGGLISGTNDGAVHIFRGIPYAAAPDELRRRRRSQRRRPAALACLRPRSGSVPGDRRCDPDGRAAAG